MTSPKPLAAIIVTYLITIKLVLPAFMRNRRPYELRSIIKWYNVMQIFANAVVTWGVGNKNNFNLSSHKRTPAAKYMSFIYEQISNHL